MVIEGLDRLDNRDAVVPTRHRAGAAVRQAGLPHALVTSSERSFMDAVLASTGMRFDVLVCAQDVTATKPDPEPYLLAAKLVDVDPGDCFALEDSANGVASAQAAGCTVIAVPSLLPIEAAAGRIVVRSLLDLQADPTGMTVLARRDEPEHPAAAGRFPPDPLGG
jgi:beta-phosphoglucomutase-like phosphatase (HAD superfamily)